MPPAIRRRIGGGASSRASPKVLSVEFMLQNHADIISIIIVCIAVGLIFEPTSRYSSRFVNLHHNSTDPLIARETNLPMLYNYGLNDMFAIFFYGLVCLVTHGVIHQYLIDRVTRKLHLSRIKHAKFHESGQLLAFYVISLIWAIELLRREHLTSLSALWANYPVEHRDMTYGFKLFYIIQIGYWVHYIPQVYLQLLQKMPREQMAPRLSYAATYIFFIAAAYLLNFTRLTLCLLFVHYIAEATFHISRLLYFSQREDLSTKTFKLWSVLFIASRLVSITLSVLAFGFGLAQQESANHSPFVDGNFNCLFIRSFCLGATCSLQAGLLWRFIVFHLKRRREQQVAVVGKKQRKNR
ncbi:Translocating chain-associated membrane protein 1-like 1 [Fragariocoptes setiger]|uniref:Translocating chain-associated membrane protein 1-like 1 n=1 Tax=Fragariocoptes setiger TaxID=1670756 RepID=A0ABQ7S6Y6_9ACAR|nr:Translocating chain-associated membrane protein 1-like 1 [Fragariocoptes setiger]